jgi:PAS domain S-box-containing protein
VDIDITERKRAEAALIASERQYRDLLERANDIVATFDFEGRITSMNAAAERVLGYTPAELVGRALREFVPPEEMPMHDAMLARKLAGELSTRYEMHIRSKDGRTVTLEVNSQLVWDADNAARGIHSIARDVSERKAAEARQELFIREQEHRIKNLLAVVQSIVRSTLANSADLASAQSTIDGRLQALGRAQQAIRSGGKAEASIVRIVENELSAFSSRVRCAGPEVFASGGFAQMFAVVLHELATNAAKYGALSAPEGIVDIQWDLQKSKMFSFVWKEQGGPPVRPPAFPGFGTKLLNSAFGKVARFEYAASGFSYAVEIPVETLGS